jgi:hypothetical protein
MLSQTKYTALCVLGTEVFYVLCLGYGAMLSNNKRDLHHALFELLPGFSWESPVRMVWGGVVLAIFAFVAGWYIAWMHNVSLIERKK